MSNLTNTTKDSIRVLDGNIPDTEGYYIVSYEGTVVAAKSDLNLRSESKELVFGDNVTAKFAADVQKLSKNEKADFDAALNVTVAPVTVDAFYATSMLFFLQRQDSDQLTKTCYCSGGSSEPPVFYLLVPDRTSLPNNKSTALIWFTPS